jgi:hypothetical protein
MTLIPGGWIDDMYLMWLCTHVTPIPHAIMSLDECRASVKSMVASTQKVWSLCRFLKNSLDLPGEPPPSLVQQHVQHIIDQNWDATFPAWMRLKGMHVAGFRLGSPLELLMSVSGEMTHIRGLSM